MRRKPGLVLILSLLAALIPAALPCLAAERGVAVLVRDGQGLVSGYAVIEPDPVRDSWLVRYASPKGGGVLVVGAKAGEAFLNANKRTIDLRGEPRLFGDGRLLGPARPGPEKSQPSQAPPDFGLAPPPEQ